MSLYNTEKFGEGVKIWIGQIVDDEYWKDNEKREKWTDPDDIPGWGARYKVRIFGDHPENVSDLSNDNLPWVEVLYPVTAGSGHAASSQTSNLRKGAFVMGIYKDQDNTEPIIIGCLGNNDQTKLKYKQTDKGFEVFSGFGGNSPEDVPPYSQPPQQGKPLESNTNSSPEQKNKADKEEKEDGKSKTPLLSSAKCKGSELTGIRLIIQNLIQKIEKLKKQLDSAAAKVNEIKSQIESAVQSASEAIAGVIKWIIDQIRKFVIEKINNTLKDTYYLLFPNERPELKKKQEKALDLLSCLFNKIISNLLKMIGTFLLQIVDRFINAPLCAVENFLGSLLGQLTGLIMGAVDAIVGPILGIISLAGDILGFVKDLLGFFSCEETQECPEIKEWSIWDGAGNNGGTLNLDFTSIFDKAKSIASSVQSSLNPDNFDIDFSGMLSSSVSSCNVGPILCGPPQIVFYGGGGSGTTGNVIVGAAGDILGVDIITPGSGYTREPFTKIIDSCGKGNGAVAKPTMGIVPPPLTISTRKNPDNSYTITWTTKQSVRVETNFGSRSLSGTFITTPTETTTYSVTAFGEEAEGQEPYVTKFVTINPSTSRITYPRQTFVGIPLNTSTKFSTSPIPRYTREVTSGKPGGGRGSSGIGTGGRGSSGIGTGGTGGTGGQCPEQPIIKPLSPSFKPKPENVGIINMVITDPGAGYLTAPDGSLGGDGRVWANANETVIKRIDGTYDIPYSPGSTIQLNSCDEVNPPDGPTYKSDKEVVITAPEAPEITFRGRSATNESGKYPVILYLCGIDIENQGINYDKDNDKVVITPDNGAILEPVFGSQGRLVELKIVDPGSTFSERPTITIQTTTGYNVKINPILCVKRLEEQLESDFVPAEKIINVVDCVGKV